jgi:hypothetical protein
MPEPGCAGSWTAPPSPIREASISVIPQSNWQFFPADYALSFGARSSEP